MHKSFMDKLSVILDTGFIKIDEPMKNHTSFKIGGPADVLVSPSTIQQTADIIKLCVKEKAAFFVLGKGSNILVSDKGMRCVVIKTSENLNNCMVNGETIYAEAGASLSGAADIALENSLGGMEFASGIPGTIGGAVVMNAGAYGKEMKDVVLESTLVDKEGRMLTINNKEHCFGYRRSVLQDEGVVLLKTILKLEKSKKDGIKELMDDLNRRRKKKQPLEMPSAGSVFKRPEGYYAGKLIEDCGLKGYSIGGAAVSGKHCGFIVNTGNATATDVMKLIACIKEIILKKYNVAMNTEIRIVGEWDF